MVGLRALIEKLEDFEKGVLESDSHPLRATLQAEPEDMIAERLASLSSMSPEKLSNFAGLLLDYRLLDISGSLQSPPLLCGQPDRLPIPLPPKMFFKQVSDWPSLVTRGLRLLRDCEDDHLSSSYNNPSTNLAQSSNPTRSIFTSLVLRKHTIEGHKIMGNFECAAAHLSLIFKGVTELPNTAPEFQILISKTCEDNDLHADRWEAFFSSIKSVHSFKLPLLLALASTPACLFLPSSIMTKDLNRLLLLQVWQGLGGPRPEQLVSIDRILWCTLFDVALGLHPMSTRFRTAFREIESFKLPNIGYPDSEWLSGDASFQATVQSQHPRKPKVLRFSKPAQPLGDTVSQRSNRETDESGVNPEPRRPFTRSVAAHASGTQKSPGPLYHSSSPASRRRTRKHVGTGEISDGSPSEKEDVPTSRKRPLSEASESNPVLSLKALKLEDGNKLRVYETVDLTVEIAGPPVIDLTVDMAGEVRFEAETLVLRNNDSVLRHIARFHSRQEAEWFSSLCRSVTPFEPLPTKQFFVVLPPEQLHQMPVCELQSVLVSGVIIIPGAIQDKRGFSDASLRSLIMLNRPVQMTDFSIPPDRDRLMAGSIKLLLQSVRTNGKALATLDFPMAGGEPPLEGLASDAHAWNMTFDQPWCNRRWEMPVSAVRTAAVTTRDAYCMFHIPANGFATQIEVRNGGQVLIVCQPAPFNPHNFFHFTLLEQLSHPPLSDWTTLTFQAFYLPAGSTAIIKPMTPFFLLSTEPSIVHTYHFIATSTLQSTCAGFLVSAITIEGSKNQAQTAAHALLRRLVHYYHLVYLEPDYFLCHPDYPHVPNVLDWGGIIALMSLCSLFELSNALLYTLSDLDRHRTIEARRLCRQMVSWLDARLIFVGAHRKRLNAYYDIFLPYLARQTKALVAYSHLVEERMPSFPGTLRAKIEATFRDHTALHAKMKDIDGWKPDGFGWPSDLVFDISIRESPGTVSDDITGEMPDDVEYLSSL
ncbi:hypothetical protein MD484_g7708, partial [Candolleomyces efflorescens]